MPVSSTTGRRRSTPASPWRRCLMGTSRLYRFAERNPAIKIRATSYSHDAPVPGNFRRLVAIHGALEVDLTGQVNAETARGRHIGLVGGQMDFIRAANRAAQVPVRELMQKNLAVYSM